MRKLAFIWCLLGTCFSIAGERPSYKPSFAEYDSTVRSIEKKTRMRVEFESWYLSSYVNISHCRLKYVEMAVAGSSEIVNEYMNQTGDGGIPLSDLDPSTVRAVEGDDDETFIRLQVRTGKEKIGLFVKPDRPRLGSEPPKNHSVLEIKIPDFYKAELETEFKRLINHCVALGL